MLKQLIIFVVIFSLERFTCGDDILMIMDEEMEVSSNNEVFDISKLEIVQMTQEEVVMNGTVAVKKSFNTPIKVTIALERKQQGMWGHFHTIIIGDFCTEVIEDNKPWSAVIAQFPEDMKNCPIDIGEAYIFEAPVGDMKEMKEKVDLSQVGQYRSLTTINAVVDMEPQDILKVTNSFEIIDANNK